MADGQRFEVSLGRESCGFIGLEEARALFEGNPEGRSGSLTYGFSVLTEGKVMAGPVRLDVRPV